MGQQPLLFRFRTTTGRTARNRGRFLALAFRQWECIFLYVLHFDSVCGLNRFLLFCRVVGFLWFSSRDFRHAVREVVGLLGMDSSLTEGCVFLGVTLTYVSGHNTVIPRVRLARLHQCISETDWGVERGV
jgi:hypothetical protein